MSSKNSILGFVGPVGAKRPKLNISLATVRSFFFFFFFVVFFFVGGRGGAQPFHLLQGTYREQICHKIYTQEFKLLHIVSKHTTISAI